MDVLSRGVALWQRRVAEPLAKGLPQWVTPGLLTGARLVLAVPLFVLLQRGWLGLALTLYAIAALTDTVDGAITRVRRQESRFGARFDPAADKVLHAAVFFAFYEQAPRLIGLVLLLDAILFVVGLLLLVVPRASGLDVRASSFGKWKLTLQAAAILTLFWNALRPAHALPNTVVQGILGGAVLFAVLSVVGYGRTLFSPIFSGRSA